MSVLFVKLSLIPISAKQDVRHPFWGNGHLFTDDFQIYAGAAFDDQLIMDMSYDEAMAESFYGVAENVAADSLDDILHEFRSVGFDAFPFLCG